jgi:IclR family transcriptional regulator, acetate operon repressor
MTATDLGGGTMGVVHDKAGAPRSGTVQSIERAFRLLETMADHGGTMGLSQLAASSGLPLPTIHRLLRTLVDLGYLRQDAGRQYLLAPRLIRLGESSGAMLNVWARPHLERLVDELGESANLAMLDGDEIVYVAQVQSRRAMRMFTEVGRRVLPHCTAVGKVLLARMPEEQVVEILHRTGMPEHTEHTITDVETFAEALTWVTEHGYAIDDQEQESGVRCVAVAVPDAPARLGLSVSGPATRMTPEAVERAVPILQSAAHELSRDLA